MIPPLDAAPGRSVGLDDLPACRWCRNRAMRDRLSAERGIGRSNRATCERPVPAGARRLLMKPDPGLIHLFEETGQRI